MTILAFDDRRGLYELENVLKELLGGKMHFMGFDSAEKVLRAAEKNGYDIAQKQAVKAWNRRADK